MFGFNKKSVYTILVKDDTNQYILGRISGIMHAMTGNSRDFAIANIEDVNGNGIGMSVLRVETDRRTYSKIAETIKKCYPNKCLFEG